LSDSIGPTFESDSPCKRSALSTGQLAQISCLLEVTARKPGNVHRGADLPGLHFIDFLLSAAAIAEPMNRAVDDGVGATVESAIQATRMVVSTNTNLGIVLLLAPLAAVPRGVPLRSGVESVLAATTVDDASRVYRAIRLANPGGLSQAPDQDIENEPTMRLRDAMALAADRDLVARQYANGFREVFDELLPVIRESLGAGETLETSIVAAFLQTLARHPDSLIVRKRGLVQGQEVSRRAGDVLKAGWPRAVNSRAECEAFDAWLRRAGKDFNPGTTADLVTAAIFVALREEAISLPSGVVSRGFANLE
jgi:triphosphoribosyl-dephospho-CoA synthase